jgi:hypothetical protein
MKSSKFFSTVVSASIICSFATALIGKMSAAQAAAPVIPACEIDIPQALIIGNVDAFEFRDSFGVTFGYTPTGVNAGVSASGSVLVSNSAMALTMLAADPLSQVNMYDANVTEDQTNTTINATINFSLFSVKPTAILNTPLAKVTMSGLSQGIAQLSSQLEQLPWTGRVLQKTSNGIVILNAGTLANVKVGDQFTIYNVQHFWSGTPCQSQYENSLRNENPAGVLTIVQVANSTSFGTISNIDQSQTILPGAEVAIKTLIGDQSRELKKKVKLGTISAKTMALPGGTTFDFANAINGQFSSVILSSDLVAD